jgi:hypothetical protein
MKKLLLLDSEVVIDLHSLGLFDKMSKSYSPCVNDISITDQALTPFSQKMKMVVQ